MVERTVRITGSAGGAVVLAIALIAGPAEGVRAADELEKIQAEAGRQWYDKYCTPCHGYDGRGAGMVPERVKLGGGAWQARNLVEAPDASGNGGVVVQMPNGQLYNTISNGFQTMMGYAAQITHADRWAIVAYVRALQRAQNASLDDVPADQRGNIR